MGILNYGYKNVGVEMSMGRNVHGLKCPWAEMSMGRNVHGSKCPWVEMSMGQNVHGSKCPRSNCPGSKCPGSKCPWAEMSFYPEAYVVMINVMINYFDHLGSTKINSLILTLFPRSMYLLERDTAKTHFKTPNSIWSHLSP